MSRYGSDPTDRVIGSMMNALRYFVWMLVYLIFLFCIDITGDMLFDDDECKSTPTIQGE